MNTKFLIAAIGAGATIVAALITTYGPLQPVHAGGITVNNNGDGAIGAINNKSVDGNDNSITNTKDSYKVEGKNNVIHNLGNKIFNIRTVNGVINISPEKGVDGSVIKRANTLNIGSYDGYSEVFHNTSDDNFYIKLHKGKAPKVYKIDETLKNYNHVEPAGVEINIENLNGDIQKEKHVNINPVTNDNRIIDNRINLEYNDTINVGVGFTNSETNIFK